MINESAVQSVFENALKLKEYETCLIVTDADKRPIAEAFYAYAKKKVTEKDKVKLLEIPVGSGPGKEPPSDVVVQMLLYDVELLITTFSLSHTTARRNASKNGIRIASMPGITAETANRCLDIDYELLQKRCLAVSSKLENAKEVRLQTEKGTDMTLQRGESTLHGSKGADLQKYGAFGNLPDGEVSFSPVESNGTCIIDASVGTIGKLEAPLKIVIENNKIVSVEGPDAEKLTAVLEAAGPKAFEVAELGIGTNDKAQICGTVLEDEKVLGTAHVGFGNSLSFGGKNDVPIHIDAVMTHAQIFIDGQKLDITI